MQRHTVLGCTAPFRRLPRAGLRVCVCLLVVSCARVRSLDTAEDGAGSLSLAADQAPDMPIDGLSGSIPVDDDLNKREGAAGHGAALPDAVAAPVPYTSVSSREAHAAVAPPSRPRTRLRDALIGEAPVFDPNAVYIVGLTNEIGDEGVLAIAPVDAPTDSIGAIDYFTQALVQPGTGHLLYQDNNYNNPLRQLRRDPLPLAPPTDLEPSYHAGETVFLANLPCNPGETTQTAQRRFLVGYDGTVYHSCGWQDTDPNPADQDWYTVDGTLIYHGTLQPYRVGPQHRMIGERDGALIVVDLDHGAELASIDLAGLSIAAVRMRADGFWVAVRESKTALARTWLDVNLDGNVVARGAYAPMPVGPTYIGDGNSWGRGAAAIDAAGWLYEFAGEGEVPVVIRRPFEGGVSEVAYRTPVGNGDAIDSPSMLSIVNAQFITGG